MHHNGDTPAPAPSRRQAILVAHGIGQQYPFQVLDSFSQGLQNSLAAEGYALDVYHRTLTPGQPFDHSIRIEATLPQQDSNAPSSRPAALTIEVYEYWWASLTAGKASFLDVVRWLRRTAFTPLRRLTYNIPLVRSLAGDQKKSLFRESCREIGRTVFSLLALLIIAGIATWLVVQAASAGSSLARALAPALSALVRIRAARDVPLTILALTYGLAFAGAIVAVLTLVWSLVFQFREIRRLKSCQPALSAFVNKALIVSPDAKLPHCLTGTPKGSVAVRPRHIPEDHAEVSVLTTTRLAFFRYSLWMAVLLTLAILGAWRFNLAPSPLYTFLDTMRGSDPEWWIKLVAPLTLLLGAAIVKGVFIGYVSDIALYATSDENSRFFAIRAQILEQATQKIRWLLRQPEYDDVAVAGHSLGSVIVYDALSRLIVESQAPNELVHETRSYVDQLRASFTGASATTARQVEITLNELCLWLSMPCRASADTLDEFEQRLTDLAARCGCAGAHDFEPSIERLRTLIVTDRPDTWKTRTPLTAGEMTGLSTMITFGSPLDKILYFFRTKVSGHELVRAHILEELYGFRRQPCLRLPAARLGDTPGFNPVTDIYWLNVSALMDPVSARLRFYTCDREVRCPYRMWGISHTHYWHDPHFYREVLDALAKGHNARDCRRTKTLAAMSASPPLFARRNTGQSVNLDRAMRQTVAGHR